MGPRRLAVDGTIVLRPAVHCRTRVHHGTRKAAGDFNGDSKADILWAERQRPCGGLADGRHACRVDGRTAR